MLRKANIEDAQTIHRIINHWAEKNLLLPRSLNQIYEHIRDYWVWQDADKVVATGALHIVGWQRLAEIKSLAVSVDYQHQGIGRKIVDRCLQEATEMKLAKVFALTFAPRFFEKMGFKEISKNELPHKIWGDCLNCVYFPDCKEQAFIYCL
jgi:amino-acid N-acetyltransferase